METKTKTIIKVFLSGPSDVLGDKDSIKSFIDERPQNDIEYQVIDQRDFPSHINGLPAQETINSYLDELKIDIYIGLMGSKFGSPTKEFGSGTEEEFTNFFEQYQKTNTPYLAFMFKETKVSIDDDVEAFLNVKNFQEKIKNIGLYQKYENSSDLRKRIDNTLSEFIKITKRSNKYSELQSSSHEVENIDIPPKLKKSFFTDWLDSPGLALSNGITKIISLSDIYVKPMLVRETAKKIPKGEWEKIEKPLEFIDNLADLPPHTIYVGGEGAGKTTILKKIFLASIKDGKVPVFFDCEEKIPSGKLYNIPRFIEDSFKKQYDIESINNYSDMPREKKVLLLDNFDAINNSKKRTALVKSFCEQSDHVFIVVDSDFYDSQFDLSLLKGSNLQDFEIFEIQEFNEKQIRELTKKWVRAGQEFDISDEVEERTVHNNVSLLRNILGFNYVPRYPFVLLVTLVGISGGEEAAEFRNPSFVRHYEYLFSKQIFSTFSTKNIELAHVFFAYFAYRLFELKDECATKDDTRKIVQDFSNLKALPLKDIEEVFYLALSGKIIIQSSEKHRFRYNYAYYYFLTKYWAESLPAKEVCQLVTRLSDNLHLKKSASILIFLAYQNHHEVIINLLQRQLKETFELENKFDFDNEAASRVVKLIEASPKMLLNEEENLKEKVHEEEERRDRKLNELEPKKKSKEEEHEDFALRSIVIIRRIEIAGQLLKCHAVKIDADKKYLLFENSVNLGLRLMNNIFSFLFHDPDSLISYLKLHLKNQRDEEDIRREVFMLANRILASHFNLWSRYLGSQMLEITADEIANKNQNSIAHQLVKIAINLEVKNHLQDIGLNDALRSCGHNNMAITVLKILVWRRLVIKPKDDRNERQRVCDLLGITVKSRKRLLQRR